MEKMVFLGSGYQGAENIGAHNYSGLRYWISVQIHPHPFQFYCSIIPYGDSFLSGVCVEGVF